MTIELEPIGVVASPLRHVDDAPRQPDEGAPAARLLLDPSVRDGLVGLSPGDRAVVITWLDQAERDLLTVHPRGDEARPAQGVFSTRSPHRPNPIGLHDVMIVEVRGSEVHVAQLDAVEGTPILDIKPALDVVDRR